MERERERAVAHCEMARRGAVCQPEPRIPYDAGRRGERRGGRELHHFSLFCAHKNAVNKNKKEHKIQFFHTTFGPHARHIIKARSYGARALCSAAFLAAPSVHRRTDGCGAAAVNAPRLLHWLTM